MSLDEKCKIGKLRVFAVGEGHAGKTSTLNSMLEKPFKLEQASTIGADVTEALENNKKR